MVAENILTPADFILPLFVCEGRGKINTIDSMPGVYRSERLRYAEEIEAVKDAIAAWIQS